MTTLDKRYPDVLEKDAPAEQVRLVADLDQAYTEAAPPELRALLRQALREHAAIPMSLHGRRHSPPPRRPLILAAVALLAAAAIASVAHAVGLLLPPADQAITSTPLEHLVVEKNLGRVLNLSQSACGLTVTVTRVYADANRVVVGLTTTPGTTPTGLVDMPRLTDAQSVELPSIFSVGGYSGQPGGSAGAVGSVITYDGSAIRGAPPEVVLRLTAPVLCSSSGTLTGATKPLIFDFTVPFTPGRVADLPQAVAAGGTTMTLERLVATPLETRLYVRGATWDNVTPILVANGRTIINVAGRSAGGVAIYTFEPLGATEKVVTATLEARTDGQPRLSGGPWTFHVTLP